jgi:hypothetical protein
MNMTRLMDVALGAALGAITVGAVVALAEPPTMDPLKLSPQYYTMRLDNARVRVLEYHLKPREKEVMHSHAEGIVVALADATVRQSFPDGSTATRTSTNGDVTWRDPLTHAVENVGSTEAHYLSVELKNCPK